MEICRSVTIYAISKKMQCNLERNTSTKFYLNLIIESMFFSDVKTENSISLLLIVLRYSNYSTSIPQKITPFRLDWKQ